LELVAEAAGGDTCNRNGSTNGDEGAACDNIRYTGNNRDKPERWRPAADRDEAAACHNIRSSSDEDRGPASCRRNGINADQHSAKDHDGSDAYRPDHNNCLATRRRNNDYRASAARSREAVA
jgi:hypothetical protein